MAFVHGALRRADAQFGTPIWERGNWDILVILDGCRHDLWTEVATEYDSLPPASESVRSNASCSIDWIERNFNAYPDEAARTGYVTANPFAAHDDPNSQSADLTEGTVGFFDPLYKTHWTELSDGEIATVPPEVVTDHAIRTWRDRDELDIDRLVVHYMQPHEPYRSRPEWGSGNHKLLENLVDEDGEAGSSIWPAIRAGEIDIDEFWRVYQDNLRWVLDDVCTRLLSNCEGSVVLSSDHGNALGEWGEWHHPAGAVSPAVRRVPWATLECSDDQTVTPDWEPSNEVTASTKEQLAALGYR